MSDRVSRRIFLQCSLLGSTMAGAAWADHAVEVHGVTIRSEQPFLGDPESRRIGLARSHTFPETSATLTIPEPSRFRILQFTDLHFFCTPQNPDRDQKTLDDFARLIDLAEPDLLAVTGDLWHENPEGRGAEYQQFAIEKVGNLGIPWLYTWGNHDVLSDYRKGHDVLSGARNALYRGGATGGNYVVQVCDATQKPVWRLVCLNSSSQGLQAEQIDWVSALASADSSPEGTFAVFHIPLKQYNDLWNKKQAAGIKLERVACELEHGAALAALKQLKGLKACICGHDHINDYSGICEGVDLIYGRATGYGGYGGERVPKGAKLYTVNCETGSYTWETLTADGTRWHPQPGQQIAHRKDAPWGQPS